MIDSILLSTKRSLGLVAEDEHFDPDIIMLINATFSTLNQLGIGPETGFEIEDAEAVWDQFLLGEKRYNIVKNYVYMKVRLTFDPPSVGAVHAALEKAIAEAEWRITTTRDYINSGATYENSGTTRPPVSTPSNDNAFGAAVLDVVDDVQFTAGVISGGTP
jgi:hypothetical protein